LIHLEGRFLRLLVLTGICILSGLIFSFLGLISCQIIFDIPIDEASTAINQLDNQKSINTTKLLLFFNSLGLFIVPAILFSILFSNKAPEFLKLNRLNPIQHFLFIVLLFFVFLPIINVTVEFNKGLVLPEFLSGLEQWIRTTEDNAMELTRSFLKMESRTDLLINILLIGVLPALGEELLFRGVIQQTFTNHSRNYHIGIWAAAFIFSAIHFQFYGFIPRLLLGAFFGYLFYWSSNLWLPIFAHFLNNTIAVLAAYYLGANGMEEKLEKVGTTESTYLFSIVAVFLFSGLLIYFKKQLVPKPIEQFYCVDFFLFHINT